MFLFRKVSKIEESEGRPRKPTNIPVQVRHCTVGTGKPSCTGSWRYRMWKINTGKLSQINKFW